jgi:hypothetical protein
MSTKGQMKQIDNVFSMNVSIIDLIQITFPKFASKMIVSLVKTRSIGVMEPAQLAVITLILASIST